MRAFGPYMVTIPLRTVPGRDEKTTLGLCADEHRFSLHAGMRCGAQQRKELERLCRYITRTAIASERQLWRNSDVSCGSEPAKVRRLVLTGVKNSDKLPRMAGSEKTRRPVWVLMQSFA